MIVEFSHIAAFSVLFVAAVWDLYTTEVPDFLSLAGVALGVGLHGVAAFVSGSLEPLVWSLGIGALFSIYGWGMYFAGMWGGADAFGMSVLGFAAPYGLSGPGLLYPVDLFLNVMIAGFLYTLSYAFYRLWKEESVVGEVLERLEEKEKRVSLEIVAASMVSGLLILLGFSGLRFFGFLLFMIIFYRFLEVLEGRAMTREVPVTELEGGEVVARNVEVDAAKRRNIIGRGVDSLEEVMGSNRLLDVAGDRFGYSEVVGITEGEIQEMLDRGVEEVKVKKGVRFVPVFPVALLITDVLGGGLAWIMLLS